MAQRDETPIIWKRGLISGTRKVILTLGIAVGCTILAVVFLLTNAGSIFLPTCIGALLSWGWTVWNWYHANDRVLLYSDRIFVERGRPLSTKVFAFSNIASVDVYLESTEGVRIRGELRE